jgi:hypothetical protein
VGAAALGRGRSSYLGQALVSVSVTRDLAPPVFGLLELLYRSRDERDGRDRLALNTGLVYRVARTLALDAAVETTVHGQGPEYVLRAGLSVLFAR